MGYKAVIGVGQSDYDTVILGQTVQIAASGSSYNSTTGVVTLVLASSPSPAISVGGRFYVLNATGAGANLSSLNGPQVAGSGTSGTTITYTIATGLTISSITGGTFNYAGNNNSVSFTSFVPVGAAVATASWSVAAPTANQTTGVLNNHSAYTASNMGLWMSSSGPSPTYLSNAINHYLVINGAQGNLLATIAAATNYANNTMIKDATHSDAVPGAPPGSGSPVKVQFAQGWGTGVEAGGAGNCVFSGVFWSADQPGGVSIPLSCGVNGPSSNPSTGGIAATAGHLLPVCGGRCSSISSSTVGQVQVLMPTAGTWSGMQINVCTPLPGQTSATAANLTSMVSATWNTLGAGNQSAAVPGNALGIVYEDATHTDAVPANSFINSKIASTGVPSVVTIFFNAHGSTWTSAQPNITPLTAVDTPFGFGANGTEVAPIGYTVPRTGGPSLVPGNRNLEQPCQIPVGGTFSNLNVIMWVATTAAPQPSFQSYPFGNPGNQNGTVSSVAGPSAMDVTHTDAVPANTEYFTVSFPNMTTSFSIASQSVAFRTPDGTGAFGMGL